jgi:hypothetical protein
MYAVVVCVVNYFYTCRNSSIIATIANLGDQSNFPPYFPRVSVPHLPDPRKERGELSRECTVRLDGDGSVEKISGDCAARIQNHG